MSLYDTLGKDSVGKSFERLDYLIPVLNHIWQNTCTFRSTCKLYFTNKTSSINHSHLTVIFTSGDHVSTLLKLIPQTPTLKLIVSFDELPDEATKAFKEWAQTQGVEFQTLAECTGL